MTFQYSAANDQVVFNLNDSIKSNSNFSSILNTKPGFIRIKLIELDPAPNFSNIENNSSTSKLKSVSSGNSQSEYYNSENGNESFNNANNNSYNSNSKSSSSSLNNKNYLLDPYCAVNVKEMIKLDGNNNDLSSIDNKKKKSYIINYSIKYN
jgi:hypothetical protein